MMMQLSNREDDDRTIVSKSVSLSNNGTSRHVLMLTLLPRTVPMHHHHPHPHPRAPIVPTLPVAEAKH